MKMSTKDEGKTMDEHKPFVSIVIPAFNVKKYIGKTLRSLINQSDNDYEVIIIDDGSSDDTCNYVSEFIDANRLVNYKIIGQTNSGVSSARNLGIMKTTGYYLYFLDADDYVSADLVKSIKKNAAKVFPDIVAWGYDKVDENSRCIEKYSDTYTLDYIEMTGVQALRDILNEPHRRSIWTCSAIYKREMLLQNNIYFTEGCVNGEDQEFIFKSLIRSSSIVFINSVMSFYVQRQTSISNSYNIRRFDVVGALDRVVQAMEAYEPQLFSDLCEKISNNYMVDNYLANYYSCAENLMSLNRIGLRRIVKKIDTEINEYYPDLTERIKHIIKRSNKNDIKRSIKFKLFGISPYLYIKVVKAMK
jgi:glycosyltransferase involved in cell wall biosynthesis